MVPSDLHEYLQMLESAGWLVRVPAEVDPQLELATIVDRVIKSPDGGKALFFEKVCGTHMPVAANLLATTEGIALALGVENLQGLTEELKRNLAATGEVAPAKALAKLVKAAEWQPVISTMPDWLSAAGKLDMLPRIKAWPGDGGAYLTLPQVYSRHPAIGTLNCGMYRVQLHGPDTATIRFRPGSDAAGQLAAWHARGEAMPVAVALGGPPVLTWLAGMALPAEVPEVAFAGYLSRRPLQMSPCRHSDLLVPASAEVVIEGTIPPGLTRREGPFGNHTGSYDVEQSAPVMQVLTVHCRRDAIFPWTLVGPPPKENVAMAKAATALLLPLVQMAVPSVRRLHMPDSGIFHRVAFVNLDLNEERPLAAIAEELWSTELLRGSRLLVLGADDHDAGDPAAVFWRMINRVDWSRDLLVVEDRLVVDARRLQGTAVAADPSVVNKVLKRWSDYHIDDSQ